MIRLIDVHQNRANHANHESLLLRAHEIVPTLFTFSILLIEAHTAQLHQLAFKNGK